MFDTFQNERSRGRKRVYIGCCGYLIYSFHALTKKENIKESF